MPTYYSKLPWMSMGPIKFGAEEASDVGVCTAAGVRLTDDNHCVPVLTRDAVCKAAGATLAADRQHCSYTFEQLCSTVGTVTGDNKEKCDLGKMMCDTMTLPSGVTKAYTSGKCILTGHTCATEIDGFVTKMDGDKCVLDIQPIESPLLFGLPNFACDLQSPAGICNSPVINAIA